MTLFEKGGQAALLWDLGIWAGEDGSNKALLWHFDCSLQHNMSVVP